MQIVSFGSFGDNLHEMSKPIFMGKEVKDVQKEELVSYRLACWVKNSADNIWKIFSIYTRK